VEQENVICENNIRDILTVIFEDHISMWDLASLDDTTRLKDHLGLHEADMQQIVEKIKSQYNIDIKDSSECKTFGDLVLLIKMKLNNGSEHKEL
jgi:acyl carrier protein